MMTTDLANGDDSTERNDVDLRELVYQTLERDGLISRLKAQLRAAVFKTIENASNVSDAPSTSHYNDLNGRVCRALVLDWLEHARLLYTQDIFQVETTAPHHPAPLSSNELFEHLHMDDVPNRSQSILHVLLNRVHQQQVFETRTFTPIDMSQVLSSHNESLVYPILLNNRSNNDFPRKKSTISIVFENIFILYSVQCSTSMCLMLIFKRQFLHRHCR
jgi:hypothetical protein